MTKTGFNHYMIRHIFESPKVIGDTLELCKQGITGFLTDFIANKFKMFYLSGSGTSYHAGLAGQYALLGLTDFAVSLIPASEVPMWINPSATNFLLVPFSQSGESIDILNATEFAIRKKAKILAVTNNQSSPLALMADYLLLTHAGRELAVAATKTFVAQLSAIYQFSIELGRTTRTPSNVSKFDYQAHLQRAPRLVQETLTSLNDPISKLADKYKKKQVFFLLGSGPNYATALEGALKLKESCNIYAEGYSTREFLHGPMQLVSEKTPLICHISPGDNVKEWLSLIQRFKKFGAPIISITTGNQEIMDLSSDSIVVPEGLPDIFLPMLYVVPLQLFSYYSSVERGLNPDKPEKLTKVVK